MVFLFLSIAWGSGSDTFDGGINSNTGFDNDEGFDSFLTMSGPARTDSHDSTDDIKEFSVVIRPKDNDSGLGLPAPILAPPPPKSPQNSSLYSGGIYINIIHMECYIIAKQLYM